MLKANYIKIPKRCTANQLADIFEKKAKENSFSQIAISLNKKKNIKGILTLGDFRRILSKFGRRENVNKHLNKSPIIVKENELNNKEAEAIAPVSTESIEETSTNLTVEEKRAQKYIDREWMPDENIDKETYLKLGGRYTKYWDDLDKENTDSNTPPNNTQETVSSN